MTDQLIQIVIIPPEPIRSEIRKMQEEFADKVSSEKVLSAPPHITLVHPCVVHDLDAVKEKIDEVCKSVHTFTLQLPTIGFFRHHPTLYYTIAPSETLQHLHEEVLEVMSEFREPSFTAYYRHAKGRAGELLKKYGSEYVKENFFAHLSLTRNDSDKDKFKELIRDLPSGKPLSIVVENIQIIVSTKDGWIVESEHELAP